jgi:YVTN family beta-propeller protein
MHRAGGGWLGGPVCFRDGRAPRNPVLFPIRFSLCLSNKKTKFMKTKHTLQFAAAVLLYVTHGVPFSTAFAQTPAGTAFTYSGQLVTNGVPVTGLYDFQCILSNAPDGSGVQLGTTIVTNAVGVTNGLFNFILDFGGVFTGNATWLALGVRTNDYGGTPGVFQPLNPLQQLTPVPYAIYAENSGNVTSAGNSGGGSGNFFVGPAGNAATSGSDNTAVGNAALVFNLSGSDNTAFGAGALFTNGIGSFNVAYGDGALESNSVGSYNTAVGSSTLYGNTTGSNNIALGYQAGYAITTGSSNIDIGNPGLASDTNIIRIGTSQTNTYIAGVINGNGGGLTNINASELVDSGNNNLYVGTLFSSQINGFSSERNTGLGDEAFDNGRFSGSDSTAVGFGCFFFGSGSENTAIGSLALANVGVEPPNSHTAGTNNIAVGYNAGVNYLSTESSNIDIGNDGVLGENSTIRIGSSQNNTYIAGIYGVSLTGGYQVYVDSTGHLGTGGSGGGGPLPSYVVTNNDTAPITFLSSLSVAGLVLPTINSTTPDVILAGGTTPLLYDDFNGNFCVGQSAGNGLDTLITHGGNNTAVGVQSLFTDVNGPGNTAVGYQALYNNSGIIGHNTAVGYQALSTNTSGGNNIALGYQAGSAFTGASGNIDIGNTGTSSDANTIRIGTSQTATYIAGVINGNGSGLTSLNGANLAAGSVSGAKIAAGAVGNAQLANSTINIITGTGLSGGGSVALGGSITLNAIGNGTGGGAAPNLQRIALLKWGVSLADNTFSVGTEPGAICFDGASIWVANSGDGTVTKLNASTGATIGIYGVGTEPSAICFDGASIWVANSSDSTVTKLNAGAGTNIGTYYVGRNPQAICFDGANIWVANYGVEDNGGYTVTELNASTGATIGTYNVGTNPNGICFDGASIWVANTGDNTVTKLNASTGATIGTYNVGSYPKGVCFDGSSIWVANYGSHNVTQLNASSGAPIGTYTVGNSPTAVCFDGASIWVANSSDWTVTQLNAGTGAPTGTYNVGGEIPYGICFDGASIWVANFGSQNVTKL